MSTIKIGHSYIYRDDGSLDDQVILTWPTAGGAETYNPNLSPHELTLLRHIVWMLNDLDQQTRGGESQVLDYVLEKIVHPLMFRDIKIAEIFHDLEGLNK